MDTLLIVLSAIAALSLVYVLLPVGTDTYRRLRGPRLVTCPDTHGPVEVGLDARYAALTSLFGRATLRVSRCARWEERQHRDCAQGCLNGLDAWTAAEHGLLTRPLRRTRDGRNKMSDIKASPCTPPGFA